MKVHLRSSLFQKKCLTLPCFQKGFNEHSKQCNQHKRLCVITFLTYRHNSRAPTKKSQNDFSKVQLFFHLVTKNSFDIGCGRQNRYVKMPISGPFLQTKIPKLVEKQRLRAAKGGVTDKI